MHKTNIGYIAEVFFCAVFICVNKVYQNSNKNRMGTALLPISCGLCIWSG